ncbi:hypothetical protein [Microbacterium sp.]|uniref:hypothetical protein n=1 Tax=Microbacterium sp. TaxID=51671 RepID=UPI0039E46E7A
MPTTLQRIQVTRTPEVNHALEVAERLWPELRMSERLARLAALGAEAASGAESAARARADRLRVLEKHRGAFADAYPQGYLESLRADWPQ